MEEERHYEVLAVR